MHLAKCEWTKAVTSDSLIVAHTDLGTMDFCASPDAQLKRWVSYTARHILCEGLRARAEGENHLFPRKDAVGIPAGFVPDLELNRLLLGNKITDKEKETIPHLENPLESLDRRRLEVIMTGAIRTQVRLDAAGI
mgnify:CR=1 FL=1